MQKIKITCLPRWISEIHLKQFFNSCGKIIVAGVDLDQNTLRPLGTGYLVFADDASMQRALAKDGCLLDGVVIRVAIDLGIEEPAVEEVIND